MTSTTRKWTLTRTSASEDQQGIGHIVALSNKDRIGKMLDIAGPAIEDFLQRVLGPELSEGTSWASLVEARDLKKGIEKSADDYRPDDPHVQFRMLTENIPHQVKPGWYPFDGHLSRPQQGFASELRDVRGEWAHAGKFSDDDAYRALDTMERLLLAMSAADAAAEVQKLRLDLRRVSSNKQDKQATKSVAENPEGAGLKPWRDVLRPHDDVATGNFQAAEFAADLYKVANDDQAQSKDYSDPVEFFGRTYLTEGLRDLIKRGTRRLSGDDNASPVINLQTNFGGGKTHSMLSLWHLAGGRPLGDFPQDLQDLVREVRDELPAGVHRVAIVGNHFKTTGATKVDGTKVNTMWGELAWQLGGREAYEIVRESDETGTNPADSLRTLLAAYSPALILIDEWVSYARELYGSDQLPAGSFDTQFGFAQSLTEAAKGTSGVLLAISIPASDVGTKNEVAAGSAEEVGGAFGLEALKRLQNVVRRLADQWRPASGDEAYHIVRQRLFVAPDAQAIADINQTARKFAEMYLSNRDEFPSETRQASYEDRIKLSYPIHPELFDRLYEDWSTLERFQRTRGVLRLMNSVIHELWTSGDASPMILPGSIPLSSPRVNPELTQYLEDHWKVVIAADVDGENSEPTRIDAETPIYGQRHIAKRLARTVFFGAAPTIGTAHKGIETQRVFLGAAIPGDTIGNFHSALTRIGDRATYFYSGSGKHWYDTQANITRQARDQAERLHKEDVWAEIKSRLAGQSSKRGPFVRVNVGPEDSADILDVDEAQLVIVHPRFTHKRQSSSEAVEFAQKATENRGSANRVNRNMVVYLAADEARMTELDTAVRQFLGWKDIAVRYTELNLNQTQKEQAESQAKRSDQTVNDRLLGAYQWVLVPEQADPQAPFTIEAKKADGQATSLAERVGKKLGNDGLMATQIAAATVRFALDHRVASVWTDGHVPVGQLWELFTRYPYMQRVRDRGVLDSGLVNQSLAWAQDGFAFADGVDADGRYRGLVLPTDASAPVITNATLLVKPHLAEEQRAEEKPAPEPGPDVPTPSPGPVPSPQPQPPLAPQAIRFFGSVTLPADSYAAQIRKIHDEVLSHLSATPGVELSIRLDIEAVAADGFGENRVRIVRENAATLKFDESGFEES